MAWFPRITGLALACGIAPGARRVALSLLLTGLLWAGVTTSVGAATAETVTWSVAPSPNHRAVTANGLNGVSCVATTSCTAVGSYDIRSPVGDQSQRTLIESWNGAALSIVPSPNAGRKTSNVLDGVSCVSATWCTAAGYYFRSTNGGKTLIESWNGVSWSVVPSPNTGSDDALYGVSCSSRSRCTAVGDYWNGRAEQTLIESWNGAASSIVPSPNVGTGGNFLKGVSCVSASSCTAVGNYITSTDTKTLIESWDGTSWTVVTSPKTRLHGNFLDGVSCVSTSSCTAVGEAGSGTLVEFWNGIAWTIASSPLGGGSLGGVSCLSRNSCTAVGSYLGDTLIESWNGVSWSIVPSPNIGRVDSVSCVSRMACTAVGAYSSFIDSWNGTAWSAVPIPKTTGRGNNVLSGVSCVTTNNCTAAGSYFNGGDQALIESWNGAVWSVVPSPNTGSDDHLNGVSCSSRSRCTAVGDYWNGSAGAEQTLIESWNGTAWSIVPSPNVVGSRINVLDGVSCVSATSCTAVGYYYPSTPGVKTLIESWNGAAWSIVPSPNKPSRKHHNVLSAVSCVSASSCTAVGTFRTRTTTRKTLIESWNGAAWSIVPSPNRPSYDNELFGVSCSAVSSCTAVGWYLGDRTTRTLIESWNGTAWSIVPSPNQSSHDNVLSAVSCVSARSCTAVGSSKNAPERTLIESLRRTSWSIVPSPDIGSRKNTLSGVSCVSATSCTADGFYRRGSDRGDITNRTLIEGSA